MADYYKSNYMPTVRQLYLPQTIVAQHGPTIFQGCVLLSHASIE